MIYNAYMRFFNIFGRKQEQAPVVSYKDIIVDQSADQKFFQVPLAEFSGAALKKAKDSLEMGRLDLEERLYMGLERYWPRYKKNVSECKDKVESMQWSIIPHSDKNEKPTDEDYKIAQLVENAVWKSKAKPDTTELGFRDAIKALVYQTITGKAVLEIVWDSDGKLVFPRCYKPLNARYYAWAYELGQKDVLRLYPDTIDYENSMEFPENKFLIGLDKSSAYHPIFNTKASALIAYYGAAVNGLAWFCQYCQLFGVPFRTAKFDGSKEDKQRLFNDLKNMGSSGVMVMPSNAELIINDKAGSGASLPQAELISLADKICDNLLLGQELTSSKGDGGSYALGEVQSNIRKETITSQARAVATIFNEQLIPAILKLNLGYIPDRLPRFEPEFGTDGLDADYIDNMDKVINKLGLSVSEEMVRDRLNLPAPKEGEAVLRRFDSYMGVDTISASATEKK